MTEPTNQPTELELVQVLPIDSIRPAPENDQIYSVITADDPQVIDLARSIQEHGQLEPIVVSRDGYIISGHRRRFACKLIRLDTIKVRVIDVWREKDPEKFFRLITDY